MTRPQLPASCINILTSRLTQFGQNSLAVQCASDFGGTLPVGATVLERFDAVAGNEIHHCVLTTQQSRNSLYLFDAVVDALNQGPLVLNGVTA